MHNENDRFENTVDNDRDQKFWGLEQRCRLFTNYLSALFVNV